MAITKLDVIRQGSCKHLEENSVFWEVSLISTYSIFRGWGGGGHLLEFEWEWEGGGVGWALIRGWALINFFCL